MNVKNLKELIKDLPDDMEVIMSKDSEGNSFTPLCEIDANNVYDPNIEGWEVNPYYITWSAEEACLDEEEWERLKNEGQTAVVFWPTN